MEKIHRWHILAVECWQKGDRRVYCRSKQSPPDPIKFAAEISDKEINFLDTIFLKGERFNKQAIHQGLEKVLSKVKPNVFLKQPLQQNLSLRISPNSKHASVGETTRTVS